MADYRELLRKAIDALPDNTGSNRRAVYEKARTALVAQLRAIDPPLPAREITTHRLALEDCIREVEHEATEKLLGRFKSVEEPVVEDEIVEPESYIAPEPEIENVEPARADADAFPAEPEPIEEIEPEPEVESTEDWAAQERSDLSVDDDDRMEPVADWAPPAFDTQNDPEPVAVEPDDRSEEIGSSWDDDNSVEHDAAPFRENDPALSIIDDVLAERSVSKPDEQAQRDTGYATGSIEDIIASAENASVKADDGASDVEPQPEPSKSDNRVIAFTAPRGVVDQSTQDRGERHFLLNEADAEGPSGVPLVDSHGQPFGARTGDTVPGEAMSSVREVDLEPGIVGRPEVSDAQVAIDRAIAALDREARGEGDDAHAEAEGEQTPSDEPQQPDTPSGGGIGALTIFLVIAVLLLGGGGVAGFWAWREGYIDLNTVFAQGGPDQPATEVAEADPTIDTFNGEGAEGTPATQTTPPAANTTPDVPAEGDPAGTVLPGEQAPSTDTVTPSTTPVEPEVAFEDRLPAEADTVDVPGEDAPAQVGIALAGEGAQSLLLEEQAGGATGAVPYSGNVEWSRGTDELGNPTIVADASIPARNLDVEVLIRRNGDANLPASHLMEVNFTMAESFVGGSIANLPGVLLKDQELVQGQPLAGASARIVGNSFLFALSSASETDVENNLNLLSNRDWMDLAMVYGTGRRAIMTLEKGEEGQEIFTDVLAAWAQLDADAAPEAE